MDFIREFGQTEWVLCGLFLLAYLLYALRLIRISKVLQLATTRVFAKFILRTVYLGLFFLALLGPYLDNEKGDSKVKAVSKDIFIALDLSLSMTATDVPPSRLERSKFAISEIFEAFSTDKIGLIVFSSDAFLQCPLTYDKKSLNIFLNAASPNIVPHKGTDLFKPLQLALNKHQKNEDIKQSAKVILLISDGEDFGDNMEEIAEEVNDEGIKVFTLGVGSSTGAKIITSSGPKRDKEGNEVLTTLNSKSLQKLARITNGEYYEISDSKNELKKLISDIDNIKGQVSEVDNVSARNQNLRYQYFLFAGLLLLLFDVLFTVKVFKL